MFTGIVQNLGKILNFNQEKGVMSLQIATQLPEKKLSKGTSLMVNGVCLTVERYDLPTSSVQVSLMEETLKRTCFSQLQMGDLVNLEPSLTLETPLAGHFVLGHVDFCGELLEVAPHLKVQIPPEKLKYFPEKGSVTLHGVSLTISERGLDFIRVELIPETLKESNLSSLSKGDLIHVEIDALTRYLESLFPKT